MASYKLPTTVNHIHTRPTGIIKCQRPRCSTCKIITPAQSVNICNRPSFKPNALMSCVSNNVIYCLTCTGCSKIYVGSTSLQLSRRINLHRSQTKNPQYTILSANAHFASCSNNNFTVTPIHQISDCKHISYLLGVEHFFINVLKPELNSTIFH